MGNPWVLPIVILILVLSLCALIFYAGGRYLDRQYELLLAQPLGPFWLRMNRKLQEKNLSYAAYVYLRRAKHLGMFVGGLILLAFILIVSQ